MSAPDGPHLTVSVRRRATAVAYGSFLLIGWSGLLVPALIRVIEGDFGQSDAGLGLFYLVSSGAYAAGSFGGGFATERFGRHRLLILSALLLGLGLGLEAVTPIWTLFVLAAVPAGLGSGVIDGGMNSLILDLAPRRPGAALNRLHVFFSLGAAGSPLAVGRLVGAGVDWRLIVLGTAGLAVLVAVLLAAQPMPTGHRRPEVETSGQPDRGAMPRRALLPLALLGLAIGCYVSAEIGASSWMVRFLSGIPNEVATATLAGFWGALTVGRLVASGIAHHFAPGPFTAACVLVAAGALLGAVVAPGAGLAAGLLVVTGLAFAPVYPMIMSIGGGLYPRRLAAVTGTLAGVAVVGGIVYPPLMGVISDSASLRVAMAGTGLLAIACGITVLAAGAASRAYSR